MSCDATAVFSRKPVGATRSTRRARRNTAGPRRSRASGAGKRCITDAETRGDEPVAAPAQCESATMCGVHRGHSTPSAGVDDASPRRTPLAARGHQTANDGGGRRTSSQSLRRWWVDRRTGVERRRRRALPDRARARSATPPQYCGDSSVPSPRRPNSTLHCGTVPESSNGSNTTSLLHADRVMDGRQCRTASDGCCTRSHDAWACSWSASRNVGPTSGSRSAAEAA